MNRIPTSFRGYRRCRDLRQAEWARMAPRWSGHIGIRLFGIALAWLALCPTAEAKKVALVIGNSAYRNVAQLVNPRNDATDIANALGRLDFAVTRLNDATFDGMRRAFLEFGRAAKDAEFAVVFYAGHGMEVGGENWLIPVDAELRSDIDVDHEALGLRSVMLTVENASRLGLVILDACRNNPFAAKMKRTVRTRAVSRGLVQVEPNANVLVAYAAKDGTVAADGSGRNSPFTSALLRHIETPGLEINFLFRNVRDEVIHATKREQQPFVYGSLSKDAIYLKPALGKPALATAVHASAEIAHWERIKNSTSIPEFESYMQTYPKGIFTALAKLRIDELKKREALPAKSERSRPELAPQGRKCFSFQGRQYCE